MRLLKKERVYHCFFFSFFLGGGGGGGLFFPRSGFIKAIISVHMYIVRSSICHPSKYQTSKFFFLDFQNLHHGSLDFQNLKVSGSPGQCRCFHDSTESLLRPCSLMSSLRFFLTCSKFAHVNQDHKDHTTSLSVSTAFLLRCTSSYCVKAVLH